MNRKGLTTLNAEDVSRTNQMRVKGAGDIDEDFERQELEHVKPE